MEIGGPISMEIGGLKHLSSKNNKRYTPPKFNSSPLEKWCLEDDPLLFGFWSLFRGELLNFGMVICLHKAQPVRWAGLASRNSASASIAIE